MRSPSFSGAMGFAALSPTLFTSASSALGANMARSVKRLRSVVHSTAHHAESFLSYVHPHLGEVCLALHLKQITLDLLTGTFYPVPIEIPRPLELSAKRLCERFAEIMAAEGLAVPWLTRATAEFFFSQATYPDACLVVATTQEGRSIEANVSMGRKRKVTSRA